MLKATARFPERNVRKQVGHDLLTFRSASDILPGGGRGEPRERVNMAVKLIITDLDGCTSPEESVPWNLDLFHQFACLCRKASEGTAPIAPLTFCTGRPQPFVEALMKLLDIRIPAICESGAVIYSLHDNHARYGPGVTEEKILGLHAVRAFLETYVLSDYPGVLMQFGKEANLSIFSEQPELFASITPRIEQFIQDAGGPELVISPSHYYLNLCLAGVDKGSTLRKLLEELTIAPEDTAGIGDTEGDLPLRETVRFFACPANAKPVIKDVADYVSPYPDIAGMLDILSRPEMRRETVAQNRVEVVV